MRRFTVGIVTLAFKIVFDYRLTIDGDSLLLPNSDAQESEMNTILTNFMNCCISLLFESKLVGRDYTEFFRIFYEISLCGHQIVRYLISKKVVGRFLDFFYEQISPYNEYFRDMLDVQYTESKKVDLGTSYEEKRKERSMWEEQMLRKPEKPVLDSRVPQKSYLWKTLCQLLLHCRFIQNAPRSEWQIGEYDYQIEQKEFVLLTPEAKFVQKIIADSHLKISYRSVAKFYSYLCYENPNISKIFIEAIRLELQSNDYHNFRSPFRCLFTLLSLQDSKFESRVYH